MKKLIICLLLILTGCKAETAKLACENFFNEYQSLSDNVLKDIDMITTKEDLKKDYNDTYKEILKRQYRDIEYVIENESYDGNTATVTIKITVYDLYKSTKQAHTYLEEHKEEFLTNNAYDSDKYIDFKLNAMKNTADRITYTIVLNCIKIDSTWQVEEPNEITLEKIHGIYNYDAK